MCLLIIILLLIGNTVQNIVNGSVGDAAIPATALTVAMFMVWILVRVSVRTVEGEVWIRRLGMGDMEFRVEPKGNDEIAKALHALEAVRPERKRRRTPQRRAELTTQLMENMQRIVHNSDRANRIVSDMTAIGRQGNGVFSKTDVNLLLANQINRAWQAVKAQEPEFSVEIQQDLADDLEPMNAIPEDLAKVFTQLVNNACQAMSQKAKHKGEGYLPKLQIETRQTPDGARIRVRDNGTGIAPEMMNRIFNPFFTTKDTKWNTGLGLSLSYDIVREHGGIIIPESKHGEYTEMTVILPHTKKADADYDVGKTDS